MGIFGNFFKPERSFPSDQTMYYIFTEFQYFPGNMVKKKVEVLTLIGYQKVFNDSTTNWSKVIILITFASSKLVARKSKVSQNSTATDS